MFCVRAAKADLAEALARREERILSKALTFSADAIRYAVKTQGPGMALCGAKVTLLHMLDGTLRACASKTATWPSRRSRPCLSRPRPRTTRPSTPASTRSSRETRRARPEAPARAWITARLATALWRARFAKPLSTPTQPTLRSQKGDISTLPKKGTFQTLP
jgi:hypothetical protein